MPLRRLNFESMPIETDYEKQKKGGRERERKSRHIFHYGNGARKRGMR